MDAVRPAPQRLDRPLRVALQGVAAVAAVAAAWLARDVLLLAFFAVVLAVVFSFPVGLVARVMPRGAAVLLVLVLLAAALGGLGLAAAPALAEQWQSVSETAPRTWRDIRDRLRRLETKASGGAVAPAKGGARESGGAERQAQGGPTGQGGGAREAVAGAAAKAAPVVAGLVASLTEAVLTLVLALFLVYQPDLYRRGVRRLVPREREATFDELWGRLRDALRRWVGGIVVSMFIMGTLAAVGLLVAGIENWLLLGVLTFLGTFVPYLGAIASAIPGLLVALAQSPHHFVLALLVYLGIHVVEGYLVQPFVMRHAVEVKPALLLVGQALFAAVFGVLGAIVATPLLVCGQVAVGYLWVERRLHRGEGGGV